MKGFPSIMPKIVFLVLFCVSMFSSSSFVFLHAQKIVNPIDLSNNAGQSVYPDVAAGPDNIVYAVWQDNSNSEGSINNTKENDIYFKRSIDAGASFQTHPIKLSDDNDNDNNIGSSELPQMAASDNNVYVVWQYHGSQKSNIYFKRSIDAGANFANVLKLSHSLSFANNPQIAASDNNVYVVWQDSSAKGKNILFTKSTDGGSTFGKVLNLSVDNNRDPTNTNISYPKVAAYGNNVYVMWNSYSTDHYGSKTGERFKINKVMFRASNDYGTNFGQTSEFNRNVSSISSSVSSSMQIAASTSDLYFLWDNYNNSSSNSDILFKRNSNGNKASTFGKVLNLSNTDGDSKDPDIAVVPPTSLSENKKNNVYVLWEDDSALNWEIFLTKSTDGGSTFGKVLNLSSNEEDSNCAHLAVDGNHAYIVWEDGDSKNREIFFMKI